MLRFLLSTFLLLYSLSQSFSQNFDPALKLWYNKPASNWNEALPIGNGRMGAMIFGTTAQEKLQLNEETLWAGGPNNNINPSFKESIPQLRNLLVESKYEEAQLLANKSLKFTNSGMPYQSLGNVLINFQGHDQVTDYYRDLNIEKAVASVKYKFRNINFKREIFSSAPDQVIVIRLTADKPKSISCTLKFESELTYQVRSEKKSLVLSGISSDHENMKGQVKFEAHLKVVVDGGKTSLENDHVNIKDANSATIYISMASNFVNYKDLSGNANKNASEYLDKALGKNFQTILKDHTADYQKYFNRVKLDLGATASVEEPTDVRIDKFAKGNDPHLAALYFQFGRYLLISCSRPGTQPANLQGIWNGVLKGPWDSKYTININTQMNYWPAEATNLTEMHQPLFKMVKELSETGKESAREIYGARGWNVHHNTDLWRTTGMVDGAFWGLWPTGGVWLSQHLWDHYMFTGDKEFLKEYYPIIKNCALYITDVLQEEPDHHWLVVSPSISPEHEYMKGKVGVSITAGATMDNQLIWDLFSNVINAAEILNQDKGFADSIRALQLRLAPMQIGQHGQLQEWIKDWDNPEDKHRHVSHLYGLFPSNQVSPYSNPKLFDAARMSLIHRGDPSTGWSMGWKVNLWARLLDGDHAYKLLTNQLQIVNEKAGESGGTYPNMFDAHPPFQIDGNFGCTSGITEMLLQSHDGAIHILPALPGQWKSGEVKGLIARGGFEIDISWVEGKVNRVKVQSKLGGNCRIRVYDKIKGEVNLNLKEASGTNSNAFYKIADVPKPLISEKATLKGTGIKETYSYDFATEKGSEYILIRKDN